MVNYVAKVVIKTTVGDPLRPVSVFELLLREWLRSSRVVVDLDVLSDAGRSSDWCWRKEKHTARNRARLSLAINNAESRSLVVLPASWVERLSEKRCRSQTHTERERERIRGKEGWSLYLGC